MRIDRIRIEGFGPFCDLDIGPLDRPVSVFLGTNEAGKSTLLQFIRTLFFGFPGRLNAQWYPPLQGGRHGGRLSIVDERGDRYEISRFSGRGIGPVEVSDAAGRVQGEPFLRDLLGGHGRDVFTNLFAFTLTELQTAAVLKNEDVNRQIYSAGVGERNLPEATRRLEQARRELFLPGGSKHQLAEVRRQILDLEDRLRESQGQSRRHGRVVAELGELASQKDALREEIATATAQIDRLRRLAAARDDFDEFEAAQHLLEQLPEIKDFPESGIARLESAQDRINAARREHRRAASALERARNALPLLPGGDPIDVNDTGVRRLVAGRSEFDSSVRSLPQRQVELVRNQSAFDAAAAELGENWSAEKISAFSVTVETRSQIADFGRRLQEAAGELANERAAHRQMEAQLDAAHAYRQSAGTQSPGTEEKTTLLAGAGAIAGSTLAAIQTGVLIATDGSPMLALGAAVCFGIALVATAAFFARRSGPRREAETEVDRLDAALQAGERRQRRAETAYQGVQADWHDWLAAAGLHPSFSPQQLSELRALATSARATLENLEATRQRIRAIQRDIDEYSATVNALADRAGLRCRPEDPASVAAAADDLIGLVERTRSSQSAFDDAGKELADREQGLADQQRELKELLSVGGAADAEQFRQRARIWSQRKSLESQAQQGLARLKRHCGAGQSIDDLCQELGELDPELAAKEMQTGNELEGLNAQLQANARREGELLAELRRLESDEESDRLLQQRDVLLGQLDQIARQWTVISLAENMLAEARRRYESERKPAIIQTAQQVFATLTDGRYPQVVAPLGSDSIEVVEADGGRKQPDNLSRGTREQLFLALRFGLIRELNQRTPRLPVAVDEVLVNFDPGRAMRAAIELVKLARTNQLLVFSCHPTTAQIFNDAAGELGEPQPAVIGLGPAEPTA